MSAPGGGPLGLGVGVPTGDGVGEPATGALRSGLLSPVSRVITTALAAINATVARAVSPSSSHRWRGAIDPRVILDSFHPFPEQRSDECSGL